MDTALQNLMEAMPPPRRPRSTKVQWPKLEERVGLRFPESFKEYVAVYGGSIWFDNWSPLYVTAKTTDEINGYLRTVSEYTSHMKGRMVKWGKFSEKLDLPLYPEKGGLLPFMIDYSGGMYSWKTAGSDPDCWSVVCRIDSQIAELRKITISGMFLEFLGRSRRMRKVWGDVNDLEPHRIKVDRG
jgi:hypothetical protein